MNNAASFNLLKFIEHRPVLSAKKIVLIIFLYVVAMAIYFLLQLHQFHYDADNATQMQITMQRSIQSLQPVLQQGAGNPVVGMLSTGTLKNNTGFYAEFEALTHIQVKGLWLNDVVIQRNPPFIKIAGVMESPDKLNQLLKQLSAQPVFQHISFVGVDVNQGLLPDVPAQYQKVIMQLKLPMFYHFVIQTAALDHQQGVAG